MKKIAITGFSGLLGNAFGKNLPKDFEVIDLYNKTKTEIPGVKTQHIKLNLANTKKIKQKLEKIDPDVIIHLAAITHIDRCEKDKKNGIKGEVWKVNVDATREIADFCKENDKKIIFLSTECVFDGKKKYYNEKDKKNPINWYGFTKNEAEDIILSKKIKSAIIRAVVAYNKDDKGRTIYGKILKSLRREKETRVVFDQSLTPTYTYDISRGIGVILKENLTGIFHIAPEKSLSPYDFAKIVAKKNKIPLKQIRKVTLKKYYGENSSLRLKNSSLMGKKTNKSLGFIPLDPEEALA